MKMKISEMGILRQLDAIEAWQEDHNVHELTCKKCSDSGKSHVNLVGKLINKSKVVVISSQSGADVVLECPECGNIQTSVPDCVYQRHIDTHMNHTIPFGQVVEMEITEDFGADAIFYGQDYKPSEGREWLKPSVGVAGDQEIVLRFVGNLRALVVGHARDCDGTPLYCLSNLRVQYNSGVMPDNIRYKLNETTTYKKWAKYLQTGISEESLTVIKGQLVPLLYKSIFIYEAML